MGFICVTREFCQHMNNASLCDVTIPLTAQTKINMNYVTVGVSEVVLFVCSEGNYLPLCNPESIEPWEL